MRKDSIGRGRSAARRVGDDRATGGCLRPRAAGRRPVPARAGPPGPGSATGCPGSRSVGTGPRAGLAVAPLVTSPPGEDLAPAPEAPPFDHTRFRQLGGHAELDCGACHGVGRAVLCADCHQQPKAHPAVAAAECFTCHGSEGGLPRPSRTPRRSAPTRRTLSAAPATPRASSRPPAWPARPVTCSLQGTLITAGQACTQCHQPAAWRPARFDHTKFARLGSHQDAACASCHVAGALLASTVQCQTCHSVPQGHAVGVAANCQTCHSPEAWKPARFQHARFALVGKHSAVPCASCHRDAVYAGKPADCASCHQTPAAHLPGLNAACERCHSPNGWRPANVDHSGFDLTGAHQSAACLRCHSDGQYDGKSTACESCHSKPANHLATAATCSQCHATSGWRPARYTHASFQLAGKHQSAACASCHTGGVYSARPSDCASCHSQPAAHISRQGRPPAASATRPTAGSRPTSATRKFALTGQHTTVACASCHANGVYAGHAEHLRVCHSQAGRTHPDGDDRLQPVPHAQRLEAGQLQPHQVRADRPAPERGLRQLPRQRGLRREAQHLRILPQPAGGAHPGGHDGLQPVPHAQRLEAGQLQPHQVRADRAAPGRGLRQLPRQRRLRRARPAPASPATASRRHTSPVGTTPCSQCHTPNGWKPANFSHTKFALTGQHQGVACASCHANGVYAGHAQHLRILPHASRRPHPGGHDAVQPVPHAQRLEAGQLQPHQVRSDRAAPGRGLRQLPHERRLRRHAQRLRILPQQAVRPHRRRAQRRAASATRPTAGNRPTSATPRSR